MKNQDFEQAKFMDLGNSPATIESARLCDFYGCLKEHMVSVADAVQAYIQAELGGDDCWISLPMEAYPRARSGTTKPSHEHPDVLRAQNDCVHKWQTYRSPVTILRKALYGHPDSVTMWEVNWKQNVNSVGFARSGAKWR